MDAFTVQQYVADWLNAGQIPGLDKVWPAMPSANNLDFNLYGDGPMRCQGIVFVTEAPEIRKGGGGARSPADPPHGVKLVTYHLQLEFVHRSSDPDWIAADRALKQDIVEGVLTMIRKDSALGTGQFPQPLFQSAGEGPAGIRPVYDPPFIDSASGQREQLAAMTLTAMAFLFG